MSQFLSIPKVAVVTTLPTAADHQYGIVAQGGKLWFSDGSTWVSFADAVAAGSNTQVMFNDGGVVAGDAGLTYNKSTDTLASGALRLPVNGKVSLDGVGGTYNYLTGTAVGSVYLQADTFSGSPCYLSLVTDTGFAIQATSGVSLTGTVAGVLQWDGNNVLTTADEGTGNGLDADTVDGQHASAFATAAQGALADTALQTSDYASNGGVLVDTATGAVQADDGGNARGAYAVDLQITRATNPQVAAGDYSTIGGGFQNQADGDYATIGGGYGNAAPALYATTSGGNQNTASGTRASVLGGSYNLASGDHSTVVGGRLNRAQGDVSFAAGWRSKADHSGSFVLSDSQDADHNSISSDRLHLRFQNGVELNGSLLGDAIFADIGTSGNTVPKNNTANTFSADQTFTESISVAKVNGFIGTDVAGSTMKAGIKLSAATECAVLKLPAYVGQVMYLLRIRGASYNVSNGIVDFLIRFHITSSTDVNSGGPAHEVIHYGSATPPVRIGYDSTLGRHFVAIGDSSSGSNYATLKSSGTIHTFYSVVAVNTYYGSGDNPEAHAGFEWTTDTDTNVSAYDQVITPTTRAATIS